MGALRKLLIGSAVVSAAGVGGVAWWMKSRPPSDVYNPRAAPFPMANIGDRNAQLAALSSQVFDVLVIGGGATGCGATMDAASRGLRVAMVERDDFSSGTSSRSTKLVHGGVRYLEKAFKEFDVSQFNLVKEALHERANFFVIAPHLTQKLAIVTPLYTWFDVPYLFAGLKMYELISGPASLAASYVMSADETMRVMPIINRDGLKGSVVYYDGQFDDARMNVSLALTAAALGCAVANHVEVMSLLKDADGKVIGARCRDRTSGMEFNVHAKVVINATGAMSEAVKHMDTPTARNTTLASAGLHVVFDQMVFGNPENRSPHATATPYELPKYGVLIPKTDDGRVLFILPWNNSLLAGTTDRPAQTDANPPPAAEDVDYILSYLNKYFTADFSRSLVTSAWCGIRPLAVAETEPAEGTTVTSKVSREHIISVSPSGLVTIQGGKWTTYRKMGEDVVDAAVAASGLRPVHPESLTARLQVVGAHTYTGDSYPALLQQQHAVPRDVAMYLATKYGDLSAQVLSFDTAFVDMRRVATATATATTAGVAAAAVAEAPYKRLHPDYPFLECEIDYAVRREWACNTVDVLVNRLRVPFFNARLAEALVPAVAARVAALRGFTRQEAERDLEDSRAYVIRMTGLGATSGMGATAAEVSART